jgi:hypothetical protein
MGDLKKILDLLRVDPEAFQGLAIGKILRFASYASSLKNDILLSQPASQSESTPPDILPPTVESFLSESCDIPAEFTKSCWEVFKETVWEESEVKRERVEKDFQKHGHIHGLSTRTHSS